MSSTPHSSTPHATDPGPQQLATLTLLAGQLADRPDSAELFHAFWARATSLPTWVLPTDADRRGPLVVDLDGVPTAHAFTSLRRAVLGASDGVDTARPLARVSVADAVAGLVRSGARRLVLDPGSGAAAVEVAWLGDLLTTYAGRPDLAHGSVDVPPRPDGPALLERRASDAEIVALVAGGADVEQPDRPGDPPPLANRTRMGLPIRTLLGLGADLEAADRTGHCALHRAADRIDPDAAQLLLALGADVHARTLRDRDVVGLAASRATVADELDEIARLADVVEVLVAAGADVTPWAQEQVGHVLAARQAQRLTLAPPDAERQDALLARLAVATGTALPAPAEASPETHAIAVGERPEERFAALRAQLVRPDGSTATVQGEVVRLCDLATDLMARPDVAGPDPELLAIARSWHDHLRSGLSSVGEPAWDCVLTLEDGDHPESQAAYMRRLTVVWVSENPALTPLSAG